MVKEEAVARRRSVKKVFLNAQKTPVSESMFLRPATLLTKSLRYSCLLENFVNFLFFLTKHLFSYNTSSGGFCKDLSAKKYLKMKFVYITIYVLFVLLSGSSVFLYAIGAFKQKKNRKKVARSTKATLFKTCFSGKLLLVYKRIIYFSKWH